MMLALWLWAIIFWVEGFEPQRPRYLAISALLITLCALTKYFGIALIPLLAVYSLARQRRLGSWAWYLLMPILALTGYQHWTKAVYGLRMITYAAHIAAGVRQEDTLHSWQMPWLISSFVGGCALPALTFAPFIWPRKKILTVCMLSALAGFLISTGRISLGEMLGPSDFYRALVPGRHSANVLHCRRVFRDGSGGRGRVET